MEKRLQRRLRPLLGLSCSWLGDQSYYRGLVFASHRSRHYSRAFLFASLLCPARQSASQLQTCAGNQFCAYRRLQVGFVRSGIEFHRLVAVGCFDRRHCVYLCLAVLSDHQGDVLRKFKTDYVSGRHDSAGGRRAYAFRPLRRAEFLRTAKSVCAAKPLRTAKS